jgi:hypothetical protein
VLSLDAVQCRYRPGLMNVQGLGPLVTGPEHLHVTWASWRSSWSVVPGAVARVQGGRLGGGGGKVWTSVVYEELVPLLVAAVQELQRLVDGL